MLPLAGMWCRKLLQSFIYGLDAVTSLLLVIITIAYPNGRIMICHCRTAGHNATCRKCVNVILSVIGTLPDIAQPCDTELAEMPKARASCFHILLTYLPVRTLSVSGLDIRKLEAFLGTANAQQSRIVLSWIHYVVPPNLRLSACADCLHSGLPHLMQSSYFLHLFSGPTSFPRVDTEPPVEGQWTAPFRADYTSLSAAWSRHGLQLHFPAPRRATVSRTCSLFTPACECISITLSGSQITNCCTVIAESPTQKNSLFLLPVSEEPRLVEGCCLRMLPIVQFHIGLCSQSRHENTKSALHIAYSHILRLLSTDVLVNDDSLCSLWLQRLPPVVQEILRAQTISSFSSVQETRGTDDHDDHGVRFPIGRKPLVTTAIAAIAAVVNIKPHILQRPTRERPSRQSAVRCEGCPTTLGDLHTVRCIQYVNISRHSRTLSSFCPFPVHKILDRTSLPQNWLQRLDLNYCYTSSDGDIFLRCFLFIGSLTAHLCLRTGFNILI
ncbi:hypothetical protein J6590_036974 [Homalodisca vitripennis]|nr:hypothetical protein J6590_036974 [Homalodisca vitripennis]